VGIEQFPDLQEGAVHGGAAAGEQHGEGFRGQIDVVGDRAGCFRPVSVPGPGRAVDRETCRSARGRSAGPASIPARTVPESGPPG
jgi:hypothetical protein